MRRAAHLDVPRLMELGAAMHAESRYARFALSPLKVEAGFRAMIDSKNAIVLVDGDPVHSMFVGYASAFWWGDELESFDVLLYVSPERRGGMSALRLIRGYIAAAQSIGVSDIKIGTSTGIDSERTMRFFERMGFQNMGAGLHFTESRAVH